MLAQIIRFFLKNQLITTILLLLIITWGVITMPFAIDKGFLPNDPVSVDAIPDIGENQQIVFAKWMGRSPQDVEDQLTYPLSSALLGIPGVKTIRSNSMFGFCSIYVIFEEGVEFYWSRSRILEKLNSLPAGLLPQGVQPSLGPDATALGQIYWYSLEGRDENGNATGGWDLHELRSIQDYYVKYALSSASGISEVASIGGHIKEYQIDVDPEALKSYQLSLSQLAKAIRQSNLDVGAKTLELNKAEYFVRGLGYIKKIEDLENSVIASPNNTPIYVKDVAKVSLGPAERRGILDKSGAEIVGGVAVARYGANPLEVINNLKAKIKEIEKGLPSKTLKDGRTSQLKIIPFYDRSELIQETIGTLQEALWLEMLITIIVIIILLMNFRASILVSSILPIAVLMCFIAMRYLGVDANIVALSGIAIAIGTMVDMGIVLSENIVERLRQNQGQKSSLDVIFEATKEVASAVITAVATTIISFLPVFTMIAAEGKLFRPLAFTKTFALIASILLVISVLPMLAHWLLGQKRKSKWLYASFHLSLIIVGIYAFMIGHWGAGSIALCFGVLESSQLLESYLSPQTYDWIKKGKNVCYAALVSFFLARSWMPLGVENSLMVNYFFVIISIALILGFFQLIIFLYPYILKFCLEYKSIFLIVPIALIVFGLKILQQTPTEFMPSLDEGSFLLMPTTMPHAGIQENKELLQMLDMAVTSIPEVESVVGKAGRVESALDPAPLSMFENIINYKSEYKTDEHGHRQRFKVDRKGKFIRDKDGNLIEDPNGNYFRQWRDHINSPDDIWNEIVQQSQLPGLTSAPKLQPIETRLVMLQSGMRSPIGIKIKGSNLDSIQKFAFALEKALKKVKGVKKEAVFADRIVGKPYLQLDLDRKALARYGLSIETVQKHLELAIGGMQLGQTVEGRERYALRLRYPRDLRNSLQDLRNILIPISKNNEVPLGDLAIMRYQQGPQSIKSENGFLLGYLLLDKQKGFSETEVVRNAIEYLEEELAAKRLRIPAGISYEFAGNYQNQVRANKRLAIVMPLALILIFLILYLEFKSIPLSLMVFTGVFVAFAGGFLMIWLYDQSWFLNFSIFGNNLRQVFQVQSINLSVAVWVGFLALFGIATDDGVLVGTYLKQSFKENQPDSIKEIRAAVIEAGKRRVRPAMMTTATTILALLPILSSTGRGADIMIPMAIPSFGGMLIQMISMFMVPVLYCMWAEFNLIRQSKKQ